MNMTQPVLFSHSFDAQGNLCEAGSCSSMTWTHIDSSHKDSNEWIKNNVEFPDQLVYEALTAEKTRPRAEEFSDGFLIILRGVNMNANSSPEDMISLRMWVTANSIVSMSKNPLKAIKDLAEQATSRPMIKNSGDLITNLSSKLFFNMESYVAELNDHLDDIEETISDEISDFQRRKIIVLRKKAIIFHRYFAPQKEVMELLSETTIPWISNVHKRHIHENLDRITRYIEDLNVIRERSQSIKDDISNSLSQKLNTNLYTLSVMTVIFLPLSFLTGLLGINVGGIPGSDYEYAFFIVCGICLFLGITQILILKLSKWL